MIIKLKSFKRPRYRTLLEYILGDEHQLSDSTGKTFLVKHNLKGRSIDAWEKQFTINEKFRQRRRKDSVLLTHEIISFHREDSQHLSLEALEDMARVYIRLRNPKGMYLAVPHFDKAHVHLHLCVSGVEYRSGKSLRISKDGFAKLKKDIQAYQIEKFPLLLKSTPTHGQKANRVRSNQEYQVKLRTARASKLDLLIEQLESCYRDSSSLQDFYHRIEQSGMKTYERSGKLTGVIVENLKFRFNRLGFTPDRLQELERTRAREHEMGEVRGKARKTIIRHR